MRTSCKTPPHFKIIVLGATGSGKTSILRRFCQNTFQNNYNATIGVDFRTRLISNPFHKRAYVKGRKSCVGNYVKHDHHSYVALEDECETDISSNASNDIENVDGNGDSFYPQNRQPTNNDERKKYRASIDSPTITVQLWDTPGQIESETLGDAFYRNADAALLVYDATSRKSFHQLTKYFDDLMKRVFTCDDSHSNSHGQTENRFERRNFPIVILANKLDILRKEASKRIKMTVSQRDVLGLGIKKMTADQLARRFYGPADGEYFSNMTREVTSSSISTESLASSFADYTTFEEEFDYIETEYESLPDRQAILNWCQKNGLIHVDTSAYDGTGVKKAVESVVLLALRFLNESEDRMLQYQNRIGPEFNINRQSTIDFHDRYSNKEEGFYCAWGCIMF